MRMKEYKFNSRVNSYYRTALEKLFYYNPRQIYHINAIEDMVEQYGTPLIAERDGYLEMRTKNCPESRSLFISLGPVLTGVLIYYQNSPANIHIIHIAIDNEYLNSDMISFLKKCVRHVNIPSVKSFSIGYLDSKHNNKIYNNIN